MSQLEKLERELVEARRSAAKWRRKSIDGCCCRFNDDDQVIAECGIHAALRNHNAHLAKALREAETEIASLKMEER
jgi:hypothetical protein